VPLADPVAARLLGDLPVEERMSSMHVWLPGGAVRSAGAGVAELARRIPGLGPAVSWAEGSSAGRGLIDAAYRVVAANRGRLSGLVADAEPTRRWRPA